MNVIVSNIPYKYLIPGIGLYEVNKHLIFPTAAWFADKVTGVSPSESKMQRDIANEYIEPIDSFLSKLEGDIIDEIFGSIGDIYNYFTEPEADDTNKNISPDMETIEQKTNIVSTNDLKIFREQLQKAQTSEPYMSKHKQNKIIQNAQPAKLPTTQFPMYQAKAKRIDKKQIDPELAKALDTGITGGQ